MEAQVGVVVVDAVYTYINMGKVNVVVVQSLDAGLVVLVVLQGAIVPVGTMDGIGLRLKVDEGLASHQRAQCGMDTHGVARHVQGYLRTGDGQTVGMYLPTVVAGGRILGYRVAQGYVQSGFLQSGTVYLYCLPVQVDTLAGNEETLEAALHMGSIDESIGIESGIGYLELVDDHLLVQQGPQLHVDHQVLHVGDGVVLSVVGGNHHEVVNGQVEGELQLHMANANLHAGLL